MSFTTFFPREKIRCYLHSNSAVFPESQNAIQYLAQIEKQYCAVLQGYDYVLAVLWGEKERMADMYGYWDIKTWPGNPTRSSWVIKEGVYVRPNGPTREGCESGCEDTDILLGGEGLLRRTCGSLEEYLSSDNPFNLPSDPVMNYAAHR